MLVAVRWNSLLNISVESACDKSTNDSESVLQCPNTVTTVPSANVDFNNQLTETEDLM